MQRNFKANLEKKKEKKSRFQLHLTHFDLLHFLTGVSVTCYINAT